MDDLSCSRTNKKHSSFATKHFQRNCLKFSTSSAAKKVSIVCGTNKRMKSEKLSNRHTHIRTETQTNRPNTVTLAVHVRRGL